MTKYIVIYYKKNLNNWDPCGRCQDDIWDVKFSSKEDALECIEELKTDSEITRINLKEIVESKILEWER